MRVIVEFVSQQKEKLSQKHVAMYMESSKSIVIQAPPRSVSSYFNYKKTHSIVLMANCDRNYEFKLVDISDSGREGDGSVLTSSYIDNALTDGSVDQPKSRQLSGTNKTFPYVLVGDVASPLKRTLKLEVNWMTQEGSLITDYRLLKTFSEIWYFDFEYFVDQYIVSPKM